MKKAPFFGKVCPKPFKYFEIGSPREGRIPTYACCPQTLPRETGDLSQNSLLEIWNDRPFQEIRESITDGNYKFCVHELCPEIQTGNLVDIGIIEDPNILKALEKKIFEIREAPSEINLSYDPVCNLACPSCRSGFITQNSPAADELMEKITEEILSLDLNNTRLIVCSSGDPFVSKHFRKLLFNLDGELYPDLKIQIMTNGLMFNQSAWEKMHKIHKNIEMCCVSIDAATEETYKITRKGGNWQTLHENLRFLSGLKMREELSFLRFDCVVQDHNFRELLDFVKMGEKYQVNEVFFQKIVNWGTFTEAEIQERSVYVEGHPLYSEFLSVITSNELKKNIVNPGNFGHLVHYKRSVKPFNLKNAILHTARKKWRKLLALMS